MITAKKLILVAAAALLVAAFLSPAYVAAAAPKKGRSHRIERSGARTGRVTVGYAKGSSAAVAGKARARGADVARKAPSVDAVVVEVPEGVSVDEFVEQLAREPGVAYVEPEVRMQAFAGMNDPSFPQQWGLSDSLGIRMPTAWDTSTGAAGVTVAVLDTGLRSSHLDAPVTISSAEKDFIDDDAIANDPEGHGTHVTGIVAAATDNSIGVAGVAPDVTIMPIRVLASNGSGTDVTAAEGIIYAADQGADVINMSFGGPESTTTLESAIAYARSKGCVIVAAAGNGASASNYVPGTLAYPAALPGVISVGSIGTYDPATPFPAMTYYTARSPFSQYGWGLDLVAPGARILSLGIANASGQPSNSSYAVGTGTSMAAPHVAGVAALVRSLHPTWTPDEVEAALEQTAQDLGTTGFDRYLGNGKVRADRAVQLVSTPTVPPNDEDVPGVAAGSGTLKGVVEWQGDPDDVHSVDVAAGETIELSLRSSAKDLDLLLFGPGATTVYDQTIAKAKSNVTGTSTEKISYRVPAGQGGTYYIDVYAYDGGGPYTLYWWKGIKSRATISGSRRVTLGSKIALYGRVTTDVGSPRPGLSLSIEALPSGSSVWRKVAAVKTSSTGTYGLTLTPSRTTKYRVRSAGQSGYLTAQSSTHSVVAYSYLSRPKAPSRVKHDAKFTSTGYMSPRHSTGARTVQLRCYRKEHGKWKLRKIAYARNRYYSATKTKYRARLSLPKRGSWKIVAKVNADALHAKTYSLPRYVTVR